MVRMYSNVADGLILPMIRSLINRILFRLDCTVKRTDRMKLKTRRLRFLSICLDLYYTRNGKVFGFDLYWYYNRHFMTWSILTTHGVLALGRNPPTFYSLSRKRRSEGTKHGTSQESSG